MANGNAQTVLNLCAPTAPVFQDYCFVQTVLVTIVLSSLLGVPQMPILAFRHCEFSDPQKAVIS